MLFEYDVFGNLDEDDDDLGDDLLFGELEVVVLVVDVVFEIFIVVKEFIWVIVSMIKLENLEDKGDFVDLFEKLFKLC